MTTTFPQLTSVEAGDYRIHVMLADGDPEEHLLVSAFAAHWAPQLDFTFARDGGDLLMQLAFVDDARELPNVIVLQYAMPRLDGFQALCELQAHPVLWQIPVIVMCDQDCRDTEIQSYRAGARWVQQRPKTSIDMSEFLSRIEEFAAQAPVDLSIYDSAGFSGVAELFDTPR